MSSDSEIDLSLAVHNLVDIVFAVVVGQSITTYTDLLFPPSVTSLAFWALLGVYASVILSWIGYHLLLQHSPYQVRTRAGKFRLTDDLAIVVMYSYLLVTVEWFREGVHQILFGFTVDPPAAYLLGYVAVFVLYMLNDVLVWSEQNRRSLWKTANPVAVYGNRDEVGHLTQTAPTFIVFVTIAGLYMVFSPTSPTTSSGLGEWATVLAAVALMVSWRWWIGTERTDEDRD